MRGVHRLRTVLFSATILGLVLHTTVAAQEPSGLRADHSPRGALWRAAAAPGWGQIYNRQYYKVPIVYAGLGGLAASAILVNQEYLLYRRAKLYIDQPRVDGRTFPEYEDEYNRLVEEKGIPASRQGIQLVPYLEATRDNLRRNRDLLYIGVGLFYGLSILDAYVSAHLLDFDVGEDLSLSIDPAPGGFSARLHVKP
ncbi:MAG: DUF5683 domain-containing protein [Rhodothermales bacterium]